jgi:hypothetical protein
VCTYSHFKIVVLLCHMVNAALEVYKLGFLLKATLFGRLAILHESKSMLEKLENFVVLLPLRQDDVSMITYLRSLRESWSRSSSSLSSSDSSGRLT